MVLKKILIKRGPKDYKKGPGPMGIDRLQKRLWALYFASARLARRAKTPLEMHYSQDLARELEKLARRHEEIRRTKGVDGAEVVE